MNYYNEFDKDAAAWLRALMDEGLIPKGEIDERSITEVEPGDLAGFRQCHFFAGIGGWPLALQLAGWPDDRPVWTGSCPCQPFSVAGKGLGEMDERHLWPVFRDLIAKCRPATIFGEQVASKAGRAWLAGVFADLEGLGYAVAGADLCAAGVGAPHIRQRIFWVANADGKERDRSLGESEPARGCGPANRSGLGNADDGHQPGRIDEEQAGSTGQAGGFGHWSDSRLILCRDGKYRRIPTEPVFQFVVDGLPAAMGNRWSELTAQIKAKIEHHANTAKISPGEVLRALLSETGEKANEWEAGRLLAFHPEKVLLVALRELNREEGELQKGVLQRVPKIPKGELRGVRIDPAEPATTSCPPPGRELEEQSPLQFTDFMHELSRESPRFREAAAMIDNLSMFPLSDGLSYKLARRGSVRPALLKGAGNAIVPQVAAEFVRAFLEA